MACTDRGGKALTGWRGLPSEGGGCRVAAAEGVVWRSLPPGWLASAGPVVLSPRALAMLPVAGSLPAAAVAWDFCHCGGPVAVGSKGWPLWRVLPWLSELPFWLPLWRPFWLLLWRCSGLLGLPGLAISGVRPGRFSGGPGPLALAGPGAGRWSSSCSVGGPPPGLAAATGRGWRQAI